MKKNNAKSSANFSLVSKYRAVLMGAAIVMIMLCHMELGFKRRDMVVPLIAVLMQTFTVGVDIFVFLSGLGLYYSYTKKKQPYFCFEKKRLLRIIPLYLIIGGTTYLLFDLLIKHLTVRTFIRDLTFISWFTEGSTRYWYILAISVFYLLFPFLYRFIHGGRNGAVKTAVFCILWWVGIELLFWIRPSLAEFRMPLARLPIFAVGIYCGKLSMEKKQINKGVAALMTVCGFAALIILKKAIPSPYYMMLYYPVRGLLGVSFICLIIMIMEALSAAAPSLYSLIAKAFSGLGGLTLELYLLHQSCLILFEYPYQILYYLAVALMLPILLAACIYWLRKQRDLRKATTER